MFSVNPLKGRLIEDNSKVHLSISYTAVLFCGKNFRVCYLIEVVSMSASNSVNVSTLVNNSTNRLYISIS